MDHQEITRPLLCWSGGIDSTFLAWRLSEGTTASDPLRVISFNFSGFSNNKTQQTARDRIADLLLQHGRHIVRVELDVSGRRADFDVCHGNNMPALWLGLANAYLREGESLAIGWHDGGVIWLVMREIFTAFDALKVATFRQGGNLTLPLSCHEKAQIVREFRAEAPDVFAECITCQYADAFDGTACGRCRTCRRLKWATAEADADEQDQEEELCAIWQKHLRDTRTAAAAIPAQ